MGRGSATVADRGILAPSGDYLGLLPGLGLGAQPPEWTVNLYRSPGNDPALRGASGPDMLLQPCQRASTDLGAPADSHRVAGLSGRAADLEPGWSWHAGCHSRD